MDIKKYASWLFNHLESIIVTFSVVGAGIVMAMSWLSSIQRHEALLISFFVVLGGFAFFLFILNQLRTYKVGRKKRVSTLDDTELEDAVRQWLTFPDIPIIIKEPEAEQFFKIEIIDPNKRPITSIRTKKEPNTISILAELAFHLDHQPLKPDEWILLKGTLAVELARLGVVFQFNDVGKSVRVIQRVLIEDNLTGFHFRDKVESVIKALVLMNAVYFNIFPKYVAEKLISDKEGSPPRQLLHDA